MPKIEISVVGKPDMPKETNGRCIVRTMLVCVVCALIVGVALVITLPNWS